MNITKDSTRPSRRPHALTGLAIAAAIALVAVAISGGSSRSQTSASHEATPTPTHSFTATTLDVSGRGTVSVRPDTASVTVGVDIILPTLAEAQAEATREMTAIVNAIQAEGVAAEDIQTSHFSVTVLQEYDENGNPTAITGYRVSNQVTVTVRDPDQVGTILDAAVAAGANNIYGIAFYVDDPSAAAAQARALAVQDARTKADQIAAAAGMTVARIVSITETSAPRPVAREFEEAAMAQDSAGAVPVQVGRTEVVVEIQVTYELR